MINETKRILITGTHNTPALAVWQELKSRGFQDFLWVGQRKSMIGDREFGIDYKTAQKYKIQFQNIFAGKLRHGFSATSMVWWGRIPAGFIHAYMILKKYKPDLIITFGSHVGLPIAFIGRRLKISILHHQQPIITGTADQHIQKLATVCCYSWKESLKYLAESVRKKAVFTGNPIRKGILEPKKMEFGFTQTRPIIAILGGNQGSRAINKVAFAALPELCQYYNVFHQTGQAGKENDITDANELSAKLNRKAVCYISKPYIFEEEMGALLNSAELVVSRSGANFCYEFAATGIYSILIPLPFSTRYEQRVNANTLEDAGIAKVIEQPMLTPQSLIDAVATAIKEKPSKESLKEAGSALIRLDGAEAIANQAEKLLG